MAPKKRGEVSMLIMQRNLAKANIERIHEFVNETGDSLPVAELDCRLEIVETYFLQALNHQSSIEEIGDGGENANSLIVRGELENLYCQVKVKIRSLMQKLRSNNKTIIQQSAMKLPDNLPKLKLPTFSGKYAEFPNFMRLFVKLVDDEPRLSVIEKFNHLLSCLSGPALRTIKALDLIEENYRVALDTLQKRFDNKHLMCQEHIKDLFNLDKIQKGSPEQLRGLIDKVAANFNALCSIQSYEEICNTFIVHLCTSSLDTESQTKLNESIECSKILNWNDCSKILQQRCQIWETYEVQTSRIQSRYTQFSKNSKTVALSAISNKCKCCNSSCDHPIWKCPEFVKLTPLERFNKVKELSLCINCFSFQHTVRQCKSSSCKRCGGSHHTMLHRDKVIDSNNSSVRQQCKHQQMPAQLQQCGDTEYNQQQLIPQQQLSAQPQQWYHAASFSKPSGSKPLTTASSMVRHQSSLTSQQFNDHTILATAMVQVKDMYGNKHFARALLDSASQLNFVTQNFAQKLNLEKVKAQHNLKLSYNF